MTRWMVLATACVAACGRIGFDPGDDLVLESLATRSNLNSVTTFRASGGLPPYTFSKTAGTGEIDAETGAFRAAAFPGRATITVDDAAGTTGVAEISFGGDFLYFIGGDDGAAHDEVYRSADGILWDLVGHLPAPRTFGLLYVFDDAMFYAGGSGQSGNGPYYDTVFRSTDGAAWSTIATLPFGLAVAGHAVFAGRMWVVGGEGPANAFLTAVLSSADGVVWRDEPAFPSPIHGSELVPYEGRLWSFAGHEPTMQSDVAYVFDGATWTALPPVPAPGEYHASTVSGGRMWLSGGLGLGDRVVWSTDGATWTDADRLPAARTDGRMIELGGELWIIGGAPADALHAPSGLGWTSPGVFPTILTAGRLVQFTPRP